MALSFLRLGTCVSLGERFDLHRFDSMFIRDLKSALVVGKESQLSSHLARQLERHGYSVIWLGLRELVDFDSAGRLAETSSLVRSTQIFWVGADSDHRKPIDELLRVNYDLPIKFFESLENLDAIEKFVTFGSALEYRHDSNNYLHSKHKLSQWVEANPASQLLHIRTHTLVGPKEPPSHMFLGQLLDSIAEGTLFQLGSPSAVRQYIPFSSFATAVVELLESHAGESNALQVGGAVPVNLYELARVILDSKQLSHLLEVVPGSSWEASLETEVGMSDDVVINLPTSLETVVTFLNTWIEQRTSSGDG